MPAFAGQSRAIFQVGGVHRLAQPASLAGQQLNALGSWRRVPSPSLPPTLFVSDKMADVSEPGEPMDVEEEERRTEAVVGVEVEGAGPAAELPLPPPPPPPNPAQIPHTHLSITPVRRISNSSISSPTITQHCLEFIIHWIYPTCSHCDYHYHLYYPETIRQ